MLTDSVGLLFLCVGGMYLLGKGFLCCLYDLSCWALRRMGEAAPNSHQGQFPSLFAVIGLLFVFPSGLLQPGGPLLSYCWFALKALGVAAFLYVCGLGLLCVYYDFRIWMMGGRPKDEGSQD